MPISYDLSALDPASFEHMVNLIAMKVLGAGHTGFGPGPDGGRDGFFEGEAPYPSSSEQWSGVWYIQSKFHRPHLSTDSQQWLLSQINNEIKEFSDTNKRRIWPDNWIIATNIDPSGAPNMGSFDKARSMVREANPHLVSRFHIWGGAKILSFLAIYPDIAKYYLSLITPGQVLASMYEGLTDSRADVTEIIRYLVVREFSEQQYTKLEQAGSTTDNRPGIQRLFTDLPVVAPLSEFSGLGAVTLARASAQNHRIQRTGPDGRAWRVWLRHPSRARVWFIRGGPGQGKSTLTQYICQIHRAALILDKDGPRVLPPQAELAREVKSYSSIGLWPIAPRIPIYIELKDFAQWFGRQGDDDAHGVLSYLATRISAHLSQPVLVGTLKRAFGTARWLLIFDGLDEVPGDVKDGVAKEVTTFIDDVLVGCDADALSVCTSRPQGYSDQFAALDAASIQLLPLSPEQALACAKPILEIDRSIEESRTYFEVLKDAMNSPAIRDIMTTPLQSHIMAVVVRDGGRPPERKWLLYNNFYQVIKKREANKQFNNKRLSALLREGDTLLKNLHNRLGFELHFRAEVSTGAQTSLTREELSVVVSEIVSELQDADVEETIQTLMEATTDRLVLVTTPESGESVRFDIRPLQEFFAGEYVYESATGDKLPERLRIIAGDPHWREVMHSLLSALVESGRRTEVSTAVQALIELNEGDEAARGLNRRMAVGGSIAARLLTEGVLDQDKRIRQQFSGSIAPLCGCTDAFRVLSSVKRLHSREWLIVQLVNSLKEQSHPENIGAASVLARILPDDHGLVSEVIRYLQLAPAEYRGGLLAAHSKWLVQQADPIPQWMLTLALKWLGQPDWLELKEQGISGAVHLLAEADRNHLVSVALSQFGDSSVANLIATLFEKEAPFRSFTSTMDLFADEDDYGILLIKYGKVNKTCDCREWADNTWKILEELNGVFKACLLIQKFRFTTDPKYLAECIEIFGKNLRMLDRLPTMTKIGLPKDLVWRGGAILTDSSATSRTISGIPNFNFPSGQNGKWEKLLDEQPRIFLLLATEKLSGLQWDLDKFLTTEGVGESFLAGLKSQPDIIFSAVHTWGKLFQMKGLPSIELRAWLRQAAASTVPQYVSFQSMPFKLNLPEEADFLPHIISAIARNDNDIIGHPRSTLREYISDPKVLLEIAQDTRWGNWTRAAAQVSYILHEEASHKADAVRGLAELYHPKMASWYPRAVGLALTEFIREEEPVALEEASKLIEAVRSEYEARLDLDPVVQTWREISRAPAHKKTKDPDVWR